MRAIKGQMEVGSRRHAVRPNKSEAIVNLTKCPMSFFDVRFFFSGNRKIGNSLLDCRCRDRL